METNEILFDKTNVMKYHAMIVFSFKSQEEIEQAMNEGKLENIIEKEQLERYIEDRFMSSSPSLREQRQEIIDDMLDEIEEMEQLSAITNVLPSGVDLEILHQLIDHKEYEKVVYLYEEPNLNINALERNILFIYVGASGSKYLLNETYKLFPVDDDSWVYFAIGAIFTDDSVLLYRIMEKLVTYDNKFYYWILGLLITFSDDINSEECKEYLSAL